MVFNSLHFVGFFVAVYALYRLLPHRGQNWLLFLSSYYFYAAWDWRFVGLLAASTIVDYTAARLLEAASLARSRRVYVVLSLGFNLTLLGFFKYFNFFADSLQVLFTGLGMPLDSLTLRVLLPVGISFYTFVTMSYVIDVYRRQIPAVHNFVDFAVFVAYFPHLVAGPILRASALLPQIQLPRQITRDQMRDGTWLILWGFFQKIYIADNLAPIANAVFEPTTQPAGVNVLLGVYAFALQIYGDFAGYSNIARGTSKLMGIELIENFRFPYLVRTPQEFWRNWHISLSTWLRDYLYIPLGGNRRGSVLTYRNLLITMLLGGLWHGAAWTFIIWGAYHGILLIAYDRADRIYAFHAWTSGRSVVARVSSWLVMFHLTCYGWLIFRARGAEQVVDLTAAIVGSFDGAAVDVKQMLAPLLFYGTPLLLVHGIAAWHDDLLVVPTLPRLVRYSVYAATFYLIMLFGNFGGSEFIYFQF